ncbi:RusA family crossover junction endodeoxyribonuclease [Hymenobacter sp. BT186]|uniref:RusA family crossover junction endodeoxyribonuclease n=1 Tax=Hymenobacter telluris TaxID=2816474 RepID=A0A939EXX1_9BACT|nr:RusA family crossover junction endodeoxyribonuclease [Hymenobacter telluris]MBO0358610.1 RusA family crossover junction endodeoxyribonuclease [Hymenobacter telluris]MBW3374636.1 RusA family crossover junction endodeoxyribonuclease [Hymenobacter norwichensis]
MPILRLVLPYPPSILNPNNRSHWAKKNPVKVRYREHCRALALSMAPTFPPGKIPLSIVFYPPRNTGDLDNMLSSCKALFDGVSDAWGVNDKLFRPMTLDVGKADKANPRVEITIGETHQLR